MSPAISPALVSRIREEAGAFFRSARGSHDWDHTERVYRLCLRIGRKEKADLGVLSLAALLHDIGREEEDRSHGRVCHGRSGAALARRILEDYGWEPAVVRAVFEAVRTHRFRRGGAPRTLEARILFDADKLDSIGAAPGRSGPGSTTRRSTSRRPSRTPARTRPTANISSSSAGSRTG